MDHKKIDPIVEDVLRLLVVVILADTRIHQEEIDSFLSVTAAIPLQDADGSALTRTWLFDWFLQNCETIRTHSESPQGDNIVAHLFVRLQVWPDKEQLLGALRSVAASDGEFHISEKVLIALAAAYWDVETPAM